MGYFSPIARPATYRRLGYLLLSFPLGIAYFTGLVTALAVSGSLLIIWVGVPLLAITVLGWRAVAGFERLIARHMIGVYIPTPPDPTDGVAGIWQKTRAIASDPVTWRSFVWLMLRFPLGIIGFVMVVLFGALTLGMVVAPLALAVASDRDPSTVVLGDFEPFFWALPVIGILVVPLFAHLINGFAGLQGAMARAFLGPTAAQQTAALRKRTTVLEERTRLAHELHDSVGHTLTMIVVQAGAGRHVYDRNPEFGREALENIETSGRRALNELDRILGILRAEQPEAERAPQAGLDRIRALVEDTGRAGVPITLEVSGELDGVAYELGRSAHRIVQEALTNVVKHAGPVPTRVDLRRTPRALEIEVANEAPDQSAAAPDVVPEGSGGRGLAGIRERVAILGGSVEAGPRPDGGFRVWVKLPLESE
jgi:signal transduction histidine kinase